MAFRLSPFILQGFQCDAASKLMPGQLSSLAQEVRSKKANLSEKQVRRSLGPGSGQIQIQVRKRHLCLPTWILIILMEIRWAEVQPCRWPLGWKVYLPAVINIQFFFCLLWEQCLIFIPSALLHGQTSQQKQPDSKPQQLSSRCSAFFPVSNSEVHFAAEAKFDDFFAAFKPAFKAFLVAFFWF